MNVAVIVVIGTAVLSVDHRLDPASEFRTVEIAMRKRIDRLSIVDPAVDADTEMLDPGHQSGDVVVFLRSGMLHDLHDFGRLVQIDPVEHLVLQRVVGVQRCLFSIPPCRPKKGIECEP